LYRESGVPKRTPEANPDAFILGFFGYLPSFGRFRVKSNAVGIDDLVANLPNRLDNGIDVVTDSLRENVDVESRAWEGSPLPHIQHQGTFQHKVAGVLRPGQSIQKALHREVLKKFVEGATSVPRLVEQALVH